MINHGKEINMSKQKSRSEYVKDDIPEEIPEEDKHVRMQHVFGIEAEPDMLIQKQIEDSGPDEMTIAPNNNAQDLKFVIQPKIFDPMNHTLEEVKNHLTEKPRTYKDDTGKEPISMVPMQFVRDAAVIRAYGNKKYNDPWSWKLVEPQRYMNALGRHVLAFLEDPNGVDEESGYPHIWHISCNVAFLSDMFKGGKFNDYNSEPK